MHRLAILTAAILAPLFAPSLAEARDCAIEFTIEITQGVGSIRPGTELAGQAEFSTRGQPIRQEGGATAHLASGQMHLGDGISGQIWTLITTTRGHAAELVGIYAIDVEGLSYGGIAYEGPMAITLFGQAGSRDTAAAPVTQSEWDALDLRRAFSLHAHGRDMLAGDVTRLDARCT